VDRLAWAHVARVRGQELSTGEWAVLALLAEGPSHGFAIAKTLAPGGSIGQIWSLPRPLVYRALEILEDLGLVKQQRIEPGKGPRRTVLTTTTRGKRLVAAWLAEPVEHVRDARSFLMLKLAFLDRAKRDPAPLLRGQRMGLVNVEDALAERAAASDGFEQTLALWRLESTRALIRFIDAVLASKTRATSRA
jgi:DNA-binding PadR family transcriptional regulator